MRNPEPATTLARVLRALRFSRPRTATSLCTSRSGRLLWLLLLCAPAWAVAQNLVYKVSGLEGELARNVDAWLGAPPETAQERGNFVESAKSKVVQGLQALGYYRPHIDMTLDRSQPTWRLAIAVDPAAPVRIRDVRVEILGQAGDDPAFDAYLASGAAPVKGAVLHHGQYEAFRSGLLMLGQKRGYFDARLAHSRVEVQAEMGWADITLRYASGQRYRFGALQYDDALADAGLLDTLKPFQTGEHFDRDKLSVFQSQLQRTRYFSTVSVQALPEAAADGRVPIAVQLYPSKRHSFDVGVGYSTDTLWRGSVTWRTPRINRYGHSQVTRIEYSQVNPSGRSTYSIPLTHPLDDTLQLWARTEDDEFGDLESRLNELGVRREIRRDKWVGSYALRGLRESWDLGQARLRNDYLLLGTTLSRRSHSGSVVDPSRGFTQLYTLEAGSKELGSDIDLLRITANFRFVTTPVPGHRIVARAELGLAEVVGGQRARLAPSLGFFAGGSQSIRGFAYQSLGREIVVDDLTDTQQTLVVGGDRLVTGSLEYQYYFSQQWRAAVFADIGDAFDVGDFDANYGAGLGIHYLTPVGAIRVELANSLSEDNPDWYVHLRIGTQF